MPTQTYPVHGPVQATVRFPVGQVTVTAGAGEHVTASVEPSTAGDLAAIALADTARISMSGDQLLVEVSERGWIRRGSASLHVRLALPVGSSVSVAVGVVDVTAEGALANASVKAGVAKVLVPEATGVVSVRGGEATVDVGSAASVSVKCGRGDVRVRSVTDLHVKAGQGGVKVGASNGQVFVKGAMVSLDLAEASAGDVAFDAAVGNATVGVVEGTRVELDLSSTTGDARSELAMDGDGAQPVQLRVRLRTTSGSVVVRPAAVPEPASAAS